MTHYVAGILDMQLLIRTGILYYFHEFIPIVLSSSLTKTKSSTLHRMVNLLSYSIRAKSFNKVGESEIS
jgi:hypothetical protein